MVCGFILTAEVRKCIVISCVLDKNKYLDILKDNLTRSVVKMGINDNDKFY